MSKEISFQEGFHVANTYNCFVGSLATIFRLYTHDKLKIFNTEDFLGDKTTDFRITNFIDLLNELGYQDITHDVIEVAKRRQTTFRVIGEALQGGAVCELSVYSRKWLKEVIGENSPDWVGENDLHSVVVYGYYQPEDEVSDGYVYLLDPYDDRKKFLPWDEVFPHIEQANGYCWLHLYNLALDHADLAYNYSVKKFNLRKPTKKLLRRLLPGKNKTDKLSHLIG